MLILLPLYGVIAQFHEEAAADHQALNLLQCDQHELAQSSPTQISNLGALSMRPMMRMQVKHGIEEDIASLQQHNACLTCEVQNLRAQLKVLLVLSV